MDLSLAITTLLIDTLAERLDTVLVLGISKNQDNQLIYHRRMVGPNSWSLMLPLEVEIKKMKKEFDEVPLTDIEF